MSIVVTGGAGFIGSAVVRALGDWGEDDIIIVDNLGRAGKFSNLLAKRFSSIMRPAQFLSEFESGSLRADVIVHMGARTDTAEADADFMLDNNTLFTRRLAFAAAERGARLIYASSASVYGDGALGFSDGDELTPRLAPLNAYAFSKWLADVWALRDGWANSAVGLRFFNVFGPNEYHKDRMASVIFHAFRQLRLSHKIALFQSHRDGVADGEQKRDLVYVKDVVSVILWFIDHPKTTGIYNVGTGEARTYNDLAASIFSAAGAERRIEYIPTPESIRASYQYFTQADLTRLRAAGCDIPFRPLEDSVRDYVENYLTVGEKHW